MAPPWHGGEDRETPPPPLLYLPPGAHTPGVRVVVLDRLRPLHDERARSMARAALSWGTAAVFSASPLGAIRARGMQWDREMFDLRMYRWFLTLA